MFVGRGTQTLEEISPLFPTKLHIWGGEGERDSGQQDPPDDDNDNDQDQDDSDDNDDDGDAGDDGDGDGDGDAAKDKNKSGEKTLEEQLEDERRARIKAEKALNKQKADKDKIEADKDAAKDRDKYKAKLEARDKFLTENLLAIEIQKQTKFQFADVDDVVLLLQTKYAEDVNIDLDADIPSVDGLDLALKRIAKDKPHFLKTSKKDEDDDAGQSSGGKIGGKNGQGSAEEEAKRLGEKYRIPGYSRQQARIM